MRRWYERWFAGLTGEGMAVGVLVCVFNALPHVDHESAHGLRRRRRAD